MKKEDQEVYIKFPADPTAPALLKIAPGPLAREATQLAESPESGWELAPCDEEGTLAFFVDRKLLRFHPKHKPRPDAAGHLAKYRAEKKAKAEPKADPAPRDQWDGFVF